MCWLLMLYTWILIVLLTNMVQVLQEQYDIESIAQHGVELLYATMTKIFSSLQEPCKGQFC